MRKRGKKRGRDVGGKKEKENKSRRVSERE